MADNKVEVIRAEFYARSPLDDVIDLKHTKADALIIHSSDAGLQRPTEEVIAEIGAGYFDRLAFPDPSEKVDHSQTVREWIAILETKHEFEEVHIIEPASRHQRAARWFIKDTFPDLKIEIHDIKSEDLESIEDLVATCADLRFQKEYDNHIRRLGLEVFDRFALAGGALAMRSPEVLSWFGRFAKSAQAKRVWLANHIDCAVAGGVSSYRNFESSEGLVHAAGLHEASIRLRSMNSNLKVYQDIVGVDSMIEVNYLKAELGIAEADGELDD